VAAPTPIFGDLRGKVAVVTGGSKGIGAATARMLGENGARVAVVARGQEAIDASVAAVRDAGGEAIGSAPTARPARAWARSGSARRRSSGRSTC